MLSNTKKVSYLKNTLTILFVIFCLATMTLNASASNSDLDINANQLGVVTIYIDGKTKPVAIKGKTTVQDLIDGLGVTLGEMDEVDTPLTAVVYSNSTVKVIRRGYSNKVVEGEINYDTVYYYSEDVMPGQEEVKVEGKNGFGTETYKQFVVDGEVKESKLIDSTYTVEPVNKEIGIGFKTTPVSNLNFNWEFGESREPINTVNVLRDQRSTAYTANSGARTASGREAMVGHVAVNPKVIPYGSKLFIQSSDGNIIYGYAIAADTGGALLSGAANVDLYFDTMSECVSHGVKPVDIFVLETP